MTKVLFLQGPPSVFWRELSDGFERSGIETKRVNFSFGDQLYWRKRGAINYRGSLRAWPRYLADLISREGITDIVYYADRLPYHRLATRVARKLGVRCYATEFGYLRPDWVTLERDGMGRFSHFPVSPDHIHSIAAGASAPDLEAKYGHNFGQEATNEVIYNLATYFGRFMFPLYKSDKYYDPLVDYLSWLPRSLRSRHNLPENYFDDETRKNYLVALQLQSDYQIRANSPYRHLSQMIEEVMASFARYAPARSRLVIKQHPLDNDLEGWRKIVTKLAARYHISDRVLFIEMGDLNTILRNSSGTIIVNSTTGMQSLRAGVPTITLGAAIYNIPGLTHQRGLDSFWRDPDPIDPNLLESLIHAMAVAIQVKGNFYHTEGRKIAITGIIDRIANGLVNEPNAFVEVPPRLEWQRLPLPPGRKRRLGGFLPGSIDLPAIELPGREILVGTGEPALSAIGAGDAGDRRHGNFR